MRWYMLHFRLIYDEILKSNVFASSRPGRTDARVILILALLLKYKRLRLEDDPIPDSAYWSVHSGNWKYGAADGQNVYWTGLDKMQEQRGAREKGLYSITQAGKKHLYELINEYFQGETVQNMVSVLDAYAAGRTNMELSSIRKQRSQRRWKWYSQIIERNGRSWSLRFRIQSKRCVSMADKRRSGEMSLQI